MSKYIIRMIVETGVGGEDIRFLRRVVDLSITPFVGLDIEDGNGFEARVHRIVYNIDRREVELWAKTNDSVCRSKSMFPGGEYITLEEMVEYYATCGWIEDG